MKGANLFKYAALVAAAAFVALPGTSTVAAADNDTAKCLRLTDASASIYSAISYIADKESDLANLPLNELLVPLDKELPWLSTCLASADVLSIGIGLLTDPTKSSCVSGLMGTASTPSVDAGNATTTADQDSFASSLCPSMNTTIFPCVNTVLVDTIEQLMASGGSCCTEMAKKLPELLGQDLKSFFAALMTRVGDVLCSVKTFVDPTTGKAKNETCGSAVMGILGNGQGLEDLLQMVQLPNDQACAAMKGDKFSATDGKTYQFFADQVSLDSCFAPMNLLFTDLAELPMISDSNFSAAFASEKCLKGGTVIAWALEEKWIVEGFTEAFDAIVSGMELSPKGQVTKTVRAGFKDMEKDFGSMCFHIPNSVDDCVYNTSVVYAFSSDVPPPTTSDKVESAPPGTSSAPSQRYIQTASMAAFGAVFLLFTL